MPTFNYQYRREVRCILEIEAATQEEADALIEGRIAELTDEDLSSDDEGEWELLWVDDGDGDPAGD